MEGKNMGHTIYDKDGLRAVLLDNEAVVIYCEGVATIEMTMQEWKEINAAMEVLEDE